MRIIHTSDWHLGQHFYGKTRASEHKKFLAWLLDQVDNYAVDAIIVAGDVFDTGVPPSYAREMYFDFVSRCHQIGCQLIVLAGNHDSPTMLGESKQVLSRLSTRVIPCVSQEISDQVFILSGKNSQAVICGIPFIRPRDLVSSQAGESAADKQANLQSAISQHYQTLYEHAQQLAKQHNPPLPIIATGHLTAVGASVSDSVREIYIGTLEAFPAQAFPPADYIALGHIHQAQKVAKSDVIRYCGSPIPLSFDEVKQDKKLLMVDFLAEASSTKPQTQVQEIVIPRFQALKMLKTALDSVHQAVEAMVTELPVNEILWLDIEIESHDYLQDITSRITNMVKALPVEVLVVRRSKKSRSLMPAQQKKVTLNELSLDEVFDARLALENWENNENRKSQITDLFKILAQEVTLANHTETSDISANAKLEQNNNSDISVTQNALNLGDKL